MGGRKNRGTNSSKKTIEKNLYKVVKREAKISGC